MSESSQLDGRRQRTDQSRRRIALAMLELARAGEVAPSAEQVAEAAGVGRRTVFRLFSDMDGVYREMHAVMVERISPTFTAAFQATTWRAKLEELIGRRARMFADMRPVKTAADAHRHRSAFLREGHRRLTRLQRDTLLAVLPESVRADAELIDALDLSFSFEAWRRLRQEQRLSIKDAIGVWRRLARALLG
jgi:AcrR family transcriptional regulator